MSDFDLRISADLQHLFNDGRALTNIHGTISNNVEYIWALEYGHSKGQAPDGMIRQNIDEYRRMVDEELQTGFNIYGATDINKAALAGISSATIRVMRAIADRTPVDTGRAKGGWTATLPGGLGGGAGGAIIEAADFNHLIERKRDGQGRFLKNNRALRQKRKRLFE